MNKAILNTDIQQFININLDSDINALLLKGTPFSEIETKTIVEQIEAKKRCKAKLPTWFSTKNVYYPNKLNIEQTSSETTANYKSDLIKGNSIIDLTGGFGVDCFYFSKRFKKVIHCEINKTLSEIVSHNLNHLKVANIETVQNDGIEYIKNSENKFDWIYIDPSRRHNSKGKVFFLKDCLPNVPEHLGLLFKHTKNIMIKTSPLLDISAGLTELNYVKTIHVVAINNEVKELLWMLEDHYNGEVNVETVNIKKEKSYFFQFSLEEEKKSESNYSIPLSYLYEPNSSILKAGGFRTVSRKLNVYKLHRHSHLYTSNDLKDFPGRRFKIKKIIQFNKKELKHLAIKKANIATRNFPQSVEQIRKKYNIKDGGVNYVFFTTDIDNNKIIILTSKID